MSTEIVNLKTRVKQLEDEIVDLQSNNNAEDTNN
jgi:hypothetical protein